MARVHKNDGPSFFAWNVIPINDISSIVTGYQIFHNYVRGHESLRGLTPAEACGIKIKGENKWLTLIQNAVSRHVTTSE